MAVDWRAGGEEEKCHVENALTRVEPSAKLCSTHDAATIPAAAAVLVDGDVDFVCRVHGHQGR